MAKGTLERGFDRREVAHRRTIWDNGPLDRLPDKCVRRPINARWVPAVHGPDGVPSAAGMEKRVTAGKALRERTPPK